MTRYVPRNFFKKSAIITTSMVVGELIEGVYSYAQDRSYARVAGIGAMFGGIFGGFFAHLCFDRHSENRTQEDPLIFPVVPSALAEEARLINPSQTTFSEIPLLEIHKPEMPSSTLESAPRVQIGKI